MLAVSANSLVPAVATSDENLKFAETDTPNVDANK
jgi:hypothetical protein